MVVDRLRDKGPKETGDQKQETNRGLSGKLGDQNQIVQYIHIMTQINIT